MRAEPRTVLVASSDRLFSEAAARYVEREIGWRTVAVGDGLLALAAVARFKPSAVVVIGGLPRVHPATFARQVERRWPGTTVVVLGETGSGDERALPDTADAATVVTALLAAKGDAPQGTDPFQPEGVELMRTLTRRERLVLRSLAEGLAPDEIAGRLAISGHTVRTHLQNLYRKLGLHSRLEVVQFAARHGLLGASTHGEGS